MSISQYTKRLKDNPSTTELTSLSMVSVFFYVIFYTFRLLILCFISHTEWIYQPVWKVAHVKEKCLVAAKDILIIMQCNSISRWCRWETSDRWCQQIKSSQVNIMFFFNICCICFNQDNYNADLTSLPLLKFGNCLFISSSFYLKHTCDGENWLACLRNHFGLAKPLVLFNDSSISDLLTQNIQPLLNTLLSIAEEPFFEF